MRGCARYTFSSLYLVAAVMACATIARAQQDNEKLVACKDIEHITDAVLISDVSVAGKSLQCGLFVKPPTVMQPITPFLAGSEWLSQMTISLVNRTDKTIVYGSILIEFLDTGDCQSLPCRTAYLTFGQIPPPDAYDGRTGKPLKTEPNRSPANFKGEQTIVLRVADYMDEITRIIDNSGLPMTSIGKISVRRAGFFFDDGMRFSLGRYSVPDPDHPGKFTLLPANYFSGRRGHNWPPGYDQ